MYTQAHTHTLAHAQGQMEAVLLAALGHAGHPSPSSNPALAHAVSQAAQAVGLPLPSPADSSPQGTPQAPPAPLPSIPPPPPPLPQQQQQQAPPQGRTGRGDEGEASLQHGARIGNDIHAAVQGEHMWTGWPPPAPAAAPAAAAAAGQAATAQVPQQGAWAGGTGAVDDLLRGLEDNDWDHLPAFTPPPDFS